MSARYYSQSGNTGTGRTSQTRPNSNARQGYSNAYGKTASGARNSASQRMPERNSYRDSGAARGYTQSGTVKDQRSPYGERTSFAREHAARNSSYRQWEDDFYRSSHHTAPKRKKKNSSPMKWIILAAALVLVFIFGRMIFSGGIGSETYYDGLSVNGIALGGYTYEEGIAVLRQTVNNRLNSAYTLEYDGRTWQFTPTNDIAASVDVESQAQLAWNIGHVGSSSDRKSQINQLKNQPINFDSPLQYNEAALDAFIEEIRGEIDKEAVNAEVRLNVTEPELIGQSSVGYALDTQQLKAMLISSMENGGAYTIALPVETVAPDISSDTAVGGLQKIVEVTTDATVSSDDRLHNIQLAMRKINAYVLEPGQQFSYNAVVGKRTEAAGFKEATAYSGNTVTKEIGGGICQVSSTLYQAVIYAGLKIDERHPHSMTVSYTEAGKDATVSDNANQDFKFTNNTEHTIYIYAYIEEDPVTQQILAKVVLYSNPLTYTVVIENQITERVDYERVYENDITGEYVYWSTDEVLKQYGKAGCRCATTRIFYDIATGEKLVTELLSNDTYRPLNEIYWRGIHNADGTTNR